MKTISPRSLIANVNVSEVVARSNSGSSLSVPSTRSSDSRNGSMSACMRDVGRMPGDHAVEQRISVELAKFGQCSADGGLTHAQLRGRGADTAVLINLL